LLISCLAALIHLDPGESARILAVFPFPSPSHMHVLSGLTKALAARGHELVVVSPFPLKQSVPNYIDIDVMDTIGDTMKRKGPESLFKMGQMRIHEISFMSWGMGLGISEGLLNSPQMKRILDDKRGFDLVIVEVFVNEALYGLAYHFKVNKILHIVHI